MGKVFQSVFGGKESSSDQHNQAYPYLQGAYSGQVANGTAANSAATGALLGTDNGQGFQNYKNSAGYQSTLDAGSQAITGNAATRGLLSSGATLKGLDKFGQDTNQNYYQNYLGNLLGIANQGNQAGSIISGSGGVSTSSSSEKPGIAGFLGKLAGGAAAGSDPRIKMDVTRVGTADNGLGIYDFHYIWEDDDAPFTRGYMADEVKALKPDALGGLIANEFMTVRYDLLPAII